MRNTVMKGVGDLTWDAEGQEGGPFHSRKLHVPTGTSGLTIGRGYDMKEKTQAQIWGDLVAAGVVKTDAELISGATGLQGAAAKKFIGDNHLQNFEISIPAQELLFQKTHKEMLDDVKRISAKSEVVAKYGKLDFGKVSGRIIDVLVDLRYRGDYTPVARGLVQQLAVENNLKAFREVLSKRSNWSNVPEDRFKRRVDFLKP